MQKRGFITLLCAALLLVALAAFSLVSGSGEESAPFTTEPAFPGLSGKIGQIASIGLFRSDLKATFLRRGKIWVVAQKRDYPADSAKVRQVALALADLKLVEPKTRLPSLYGRLDVEKPGKGKATLVTLKEKSGSTIASLIVGKENYDRLGAGENGVYVRLPGKRQSWLASGSLDLSSPLDDWLDAKILDIPYTRIQTVTLTAPDGNKLVITRPSPSADFTVTGLTPGEKLKNRATIAGPAGALNGLDLEDVAPIAKLKPPATGVTVAQYDTFDGLKVALRLFDQGGHSWIAVSAVGSGKAASQAKRIESRVEGWSYRIPSFKAKLLRTTLADLVVPPAKK